MDNKRIIFQNAEGGVSIVIPAPGISQEEALKAVPAGANYEIVDAADIPDDRTFRNAWFHDTTPAPQKIGVDLNAAKDVAHTMRRAKRAEEFAPLDVKATIPSEATAAEAARQAIRDKYAVLQNQINQSADVGQLKAVIEGM